MFFHFFLIKLLYFVAHQNLVAMSAVPPTYAEAVAMHPSPLDPPPPLTVKLQVWHYTSQGRSPEYNEQLANLFRNNNLQDWDVVPLDGAGVTGLDSQDQYVPVEVRVPLISSLCTGNKTNCF